MEDRELSKEPEERVEEETSELLEEELDGIAGGLPPTGGEVEDIEGTEFIRKF